ncbi:MAG: alpha-N-acetylglucosaminidase N-terminal domain-containing protein [Tannerella sp.]|nr:alpha-N-acetylglucosaminidase N-terminal domain-containing protein [Tannerella sp.]
MKKILVFTLFIIFSNSISAEKNSTAINSLVSRLMPGHEEQIRLILNKKTKQSYFKISTSGNKICIEGNSPVSIASGINYSCESVVENLTNRKMFKIFIINKINALTFVQSPRNH